MQIIGVLISYISLIEYTPLYFIIKQEQLKILSPKMGMSVKKNLRVTWATGMGSIFDNKQLV